MPNVTSRLGLKKPLPTEVADISVINENYDTLDQRVALQADLEALIGTNNRSVNFVKALNLSIDTRSSVLTYTAGQLTKVEEKDGSFVVKSTSITYDSLRRVSTITESAGGKTVTTTLQYNIDGTLGSVTKAVK
ncbi:hypothetical protein [Brevibacillus borstelensis]|uniref:hypothetical protein n=1 Tax=Brevibacillus borstelensis TaxID=45462 RepID=UPI0030C2F9C6